MEELMGVLVGQNVDKSKRLVSNKMVWYLAPILFSTRTYQLINYLLVARGGQFSCTRHWLFEQCYYDSWSSYKLHITILQYKSSLYPPSFFVHSVCTRKLSAKDVYQSQTLLVPCVQRDAALVTSLEWRVAATCNTITCSAGHAEWSAKTLYIGTVWQSCLSNTHFSDVWMWTRVTMS